MNLHNRWVDFFPAPEGCTRNESCCKPTLAQSAQEQSSDGSRPILLFLLVLFGTNIVVSCRRLETTLHRQLRILEVPNFLRN
jgi:hypothetical protein